MAEREQRKVHRSCTDPSRGQRRLVSEKDSRELFGDISSEDKTLKIYAKLFHEIYNEVEKEEVIDDTLFWIEKHL